MYVRYLQFKSPLSFSVNEKLIFFWYNLPKPTNQFLAVTNFLLNWFPPLPSPPSDPRDGIASRYTFFMMKHKRTIFEFYILACQSKYILCFGAEPGPLFD